MAGIDISKLKNAQFDDEEEKKTSSSSSSSAMAGMGSAMAAMAGMVERKEEKKPHDFKYFTPEEREQYKNLKSKKELDMFYENHVDNKFAKLEKQADKALQILKSTKPGTQAWEDANKLFSDATDKMVEAATDLLHLKR